MYASTLPRSNWLRRASIRLAWYRHMPASSLVSKDIECWLQAYYNRQLDINSNRQNDETTMLTAEQCETFFSVQEWCRDNLLFVTVMSMKCYYGRPLSVSGRPCYILPMFYLFIFLWRPYSPALVNGGSRKFYTWWTLSAIEEVTTWIFPGHPETTGWAKKWRNLAYF